MKTSMKALTLVLCAVLLICASVMGTLAYLKAQTGPVKNTFTVGQVSISLDEARVNEYGEEIAGADRVSGNKYKLLPGHTYVKDPTVVVAEGSELCYVRMLVTITDFADVKAVLGNDFLPQNFVQGWDSAKWISTKITEDTTANTATYEFRFVNIVDARTAAQTLPALFESFTIPGYVNNANLAKLSDMEINVVAHAIQADGFNDANAAWTAFDAQA